MSLHTFGTITGFTIPGLTSPTGWTQDYLNDYEYNPPTGVTSNYTGFTYWAIGSSRINEKKLYGNAGYSGVTLHNYSGGTYSAYTFTTTFNTGTTSLYYADFPDGYTMITGNTTGFTKEEVINYTLTRNEHFLGFVEQPQIYSDVFVNRGKQGVMERNFKLGEIENTGELSIYGNGYFKIKKQ